ncbi:hypothetical protein V2J09_015354 [Rumex salicifolius]
MSSDGSELERSREPTLRDHELGLSEFSSHPGDYQFHTTSALEIMRETVRILRFNSTAFMAIAALLICPVTSVSLTNILVDHSMVRRLTTRLLLISKAAGLPLNPIGLYDHRVKTVSYGDGSSRLWEGPLLVFICKWLKMESSTEEKQLILEMETVSSPHHPSDAE